MASRASWAGGTTAGPLVTIAAVAAVLTTGCSSRKPITKDGDAAASAQGAGPCFQFSFPANASCGPGAFCGVGVRSGVVNVNTCFAYPADCGDCNCAVEAMRRWYQSHLPGVALPPTCGCKEANGADVEGGDHPPFAICTDP